MTLKVFVVDNGGQWTHREWRVLKYLNVETEIVPNTTPFEDLKNLDGLVLSGGAPRISIDKKLGKIDEYLDSAVYPILGICVGHQYLAKYFGSVVGAAEIPEYGRTKISVQNANELFENLPTEFYVWESHNDEVKKVPSSFEILASSEYCSVQAIKYLKKPFYGVQFHPEVEHTEYGYEIFKNFLKLCKK
jgi:GMP synthase (glutamine-hydrolysing)